MSCVKQYHNVTSAISSGLSNPDDIIRTIDIFDKLIDIEIKNGLYSEYENTIRKYENEIRNQITQSINDETALLYYIKNHPQSNVVHVLAGMGLLSVPWESKVWEHKNQIDNTPAHIAAYMGVLRAPYESNVWTLKNKIGTTPAHLASIHNSFCPPLTSQLWRIENKNKQTPMHIAAGKRHLEIPIDSDLWLLRDITGMTPLHIAVENNTVHLEESSQLWDIHDSKGWTIAHSAARGSMPQWSKDSRLWFMVDKDNITPVHTLAHRGWVNFEPDDKRWYLPDVNGITPAHIAASKGKLNAPWDSQLWTIRDKKGDTPAHKMAQNGHFNAPLLSKLWLIRNNRGITPAHHMHCLEKIMAFHPDSIIFESKDWIHLITGEPTTIQGLALTLRLMAIDMENNHYGTILSRRFNYYQNQNIIIEQCSRNEKDVIFTENFLRYQIPYLAAQNNTYFKMLNNVLFYISENKDTYSRYWERLLSLPVKRVSIYSDENINVDEILKTKGLLEPLQEKIRQSIDFQFFEH